MEQLSSCYFCGGALDASLEEYPVVPESLRPSGAEQGTIVLCQTCKRKLDAVVDSVVEAAQEGVSGSTDASNSRDTGDTVDQSGNTSDIETTLGDDADVLQPVSDDEVANGPGQEQSPSSESKSSTASGNASDSGADDSPTYSGGRRAGHNKTSVDSSDDESATDEDAESSTPKNEATLTRLENTKVMRLLQNREFPVDQDEFVTVASSAYEISPSDCEKVIDLAIEHDLLDERNGQLVAGARWG